MVIFHSHIYLNNKAHPLLLLCKVQFITDNFTHGKDPEYPLTPTLTHQYPTSTSGGGGGHLEATFTQQVALFAWSDVAKNCS